MDQLNDYMNIIESKVIERDSLLIYTGFYQLKKMYCFLNELSTTSVDELIVINNTKIIELTKLINSYIIKYNEAEERYNKEQIDLNDDKSNIYHKNNLIEKIDLHTINSLNIYTPEFKSIDIDIIQSIDSESMELKEKMVVLETTFLKLSSVIIRQKYLTNMIFLSSLNKINLDEINFELNNIEQYISLLMNEIITCKNSISDEIKQDVYLDQYKKHIDFNEKYVSFLF